MGDFEFDTDLLISLVEARTVLWDKTDGSYKDRNKTKKAWREVCICIQEGFETLGDAKKKTLLVNIAITCLTQLIEIYTIFFLFYVLYCSYF